MRKIRTITILFMIISMFLSACGGPTPTPDAMMDKPTDDMMMSKTTTPDAMMDKPTGDMMMDKTPTPDAMMHETGTPEAMMESPSWFGAALTDVRSGKTFSLNDFKGKVVLVETMAVWCSNCLKQQGQVKALHALIGENDDFISIGLDIDPNENAVDLKSYVEAKGFDWLYAVPSAEVTREIGNLYTAQFLNPPSTPILIVDRHGVAHPLPFGIKSAEDLEKVVKMYLNEGM
jgi:thiol-disulfide isomerase/thioredoxin